jgi:hypothetical protein
VLLKQLSEILQDGQEAELNAAFAAFSCRDKDVENFLKTKAIEHERRKKSRTYLVLAEADELCVLAYFTLSLKILTFDSELSKTAIQTIDGFNKRAKAVPVMLIGQFGKDSAAAAVESLTGDTLMSLCKYYLGGAQSIVGGRVALVECLPVAPVMSFYERNGFKFLQKDENDKYHQMILTL